MGPTEARTTTGLSVTTTTGPTPATAATTRRTTTTGHRHRRPSTGPRPVAAAPSISRRPTVTGSRPVSPTRASTPFTGGPTTSWSATSPTRWRFLLFLIGYSKAVLYQLLATFALLLCCVQILPRVSLTNWMKSFCRSHFSLGPLDLWQKHSCVKR